MSNHDSNPMDTMQQGSQPTPAFSTCQANAKCVIASCKDQAVPVITCVCCGNKAHMSCILRKYKESSNTACKNGADWMTDFIAQNHFMYTCQTCFAKTNGFALPLTTPSKDNIDLSLLHNQVNDIQSKIADITASLSKLNYNYAACNNHQLVSSVDQKDSQAATYASVAVASKDLKNAVQSAVDATIRKHKNEDRDHASVAIHNFRDCGNDANDVREFCEYIGCNVSIVRTTRLGRFVKQRSHASLRSSLRPA